MKQRIIFCLAILGSIGIPQSIKADAWWGEGYRSPEWVLSHGGTLIYYKINTKGGSGSYKARMYQGGSMAELEYGSSGYFDDAKTGNYSIIAFKGTKKIASIDVSACPGGKISVVLDEKSKGGSATGCSKPASSVSISVPVKRNKPVFWRESLTKEIPYLNHWLFDNFKKAEEFKKRERFLYSAPNNSPNYSYFSCLDNSDLNKKHPTVYSELSKSNVSYFLESISFLNKLASFSNKEEPVVKQEIVVDYQKIMGLESKLNKLITEIEHDKSDNKTDIDSDQVKIAILNHFRRYQVLLSQSSKIYQKMIIAFNINSQASINALENNLYQEKLKFDSEKEFKLLSQGRIVY